MHPAAAGGGVLTTAASLDRVLHVSPGLFRAGLGHSRDLHSDQSQWGTLPGTPSQRGPADHSVCGHTPHKPSQHPRPRLRDLVAALLRQVPHLLLKTNCESGLGSQQY